MMIMMMMNDVVQQLPELMRFAQQIHKVHLVKLDEEEEDDDDDVKSLKNDEDVNGFDIPRSKCPSLPANSSLI